MSILSIVAQQIIDSGVARPTLTEWSGPTTSGASHWTSPTKRNHHRHPHARNPAGTKAVKQAKKHRIGLTGRGY